MARIGDAVGDVPLNDNWHDAIRKAMEVVIPKVKYRLLTTLEDGNFTQDGIQDGWLFAEIALNTSTWTALPVTALTDRKVLMIRNPTGIEIKYNSDKTAALPGTYTGMPLPAQGEVFINAGDGVTVYAKSASGTPTIYVLELA